MSVWEKFKNKFGQIKINLTSLDDQPLWEILPGVWGENDKLKRNQSPTRWRPATVFKSDPGNHPGSRQEDGEITPAVLFPANC